MTSIGTISVATRGNLAYLSGGHSASYNLTTNYGYVPVCVRGRGNETKGGEKGKNNGRQCICVSVIILCALGRTYCCFDRKFHGNSKLNIALHRKTISQLSWVPRCVTVKSRGCQFKPGLPYHWE